MSLPEQVAEAEKSSREIATYVFSRNTRYYAYIYKSVREKVKEKKDTYKLKWW